MPPRSVPLRILHVGHPAERPDPAPRGKTPLGEAARSAATFTPCEGEELTEPFHDLSNLE
jgi:hypothetical protein